METAGVLGKPLTASQQPIEDTAAVDLAVLEQAGWKLPADPFTQKPYHYRRDGAGFLVWSAGPDMDDDNGCPQDLERLSQLSDEQRQRERNNYDLPFRCAK